jgi:serine/threonine protein kinase
MLCIIFIKWVKFKLDFFLLIEFLFLDIVHRDLKLENILLKNTPTSKTDEFDIRVNIFFDRKFFLIKILKLRLQILD